MLTFRDTDKKFELQGDPLKLISNKNYKVDLANLSVIKSLISQKNSISMKKLCVIKILGINDL